MMTAGCAPDSREQGSEVKTTYEPAQPNIQDEEGYKVVRGSTRVQDVNVNFDPATKGMTLKGRVEFLPVRSKTVQTVDLNLAGILDAHGFIALKPLNPVAAQAETLKVAAKATCLSESGDCRSSFIDIYVYHNDIVYHHQVESIQDDLTAADPEEEQVPDEELETEGGSDDVEGEPGRYVGDVADDIEKILEVKKPEVKKEEPKKEEPKQQEPKKDLPKTETPPRKEEPKKDPPKVEQPKTETPPKKDPPKKEEPKTVPPKKKEEPKKDDPKKDDAKKEEPKQEPKEEPKKETPATTPAINKVSQAIGAVNAGRLENAANMLVYEQNHQPSGFHVIRPERKTHFATNELAYIIVQMANITKKDLPGYQMSIGDLSREKGGKLGRHKSHTNGLDADVAFYFDNKNLQGAFTSAVTINKPHANWMMKQQWKLFKEVVNTQLIDRIFIHGTLKKALCEHAIATGELKKGDMQSLAAQTLRRLISEKDHHNHFHLRVKCSKAQVRCRQMAEPVNTTGC